MRRLNLTRRSSLIAQGSTLQRAIFLLGPYIFIAVIQLSIGTPAIVMGFGLAGAAVSSAPCILFDIDLLTLVPLIFFFRYTGVAMVLKTVAMQQLQTFLQNAETSYGLVAVILTAVTCSTLLVRFLSRGKGVLPQPTSDIGLQKIVAFSACVGFAGAVMSVGSASHVSGLAATGVMNQLGATFRPLYLLAIVTETLRRIRHHNGKVISPIFVALLCFGVLIAFAANTREFAIDCAIAALITLVVTKSIRWQYIVGGVLALFAFTYFVSPVVLASRQIKYGQSTSEYISATANMAAQAAADPNYLNSLKNNYAAGARVRSQTTQNDYYGNGSNIANRLSWIGLVDTIYSVADNHERFGLSSGSQIFERLKPRFFFPDKLVARDTYSDYLAKRLGLERADNSGALSFSLPMEGYASFGILGLIFYPFFGVACILLFISTCSSLRTVQLFSISFIVIFQHSLFEQTADGYIDILTRGIPITAAIFFLTLKLSRIGSATTSSSSGPKRIGGYRRSNA